MKEIVVITGATGFVGRNFIERIVDEKGYELICIVRRSSEISFLEELKVKTVFWEDAGPFLEKAKYVVHIAGELIQKNKLKYENNGFMMKFLLEKVDKKRLKRFIYLSTYLAGVEGSLYGASKLKAEVLLIGSGIKYSILRVGPIYGRYDTLNVAALIEMAKKSPVVPVVAGSVEVYPMYAGDVVEIVKFCLRSEVKGVYYVSAEQGILLKDLAKTIAKILGKKRIVVSIPKGVAYPLVFVYEKLFSKPRFVVEQLNYLGKMNPVPRGDVEKDFGVKLTSLEEGLRRTLG